MVINPSFLKHWPQPDIPLNILCGTAERPCFMTHWSKFLFTINTKKCAHINSLVGIEVDVTRWFGDNCFKTSSMAFLLFVFLEHEGTVFGHEGGAVEE